MIDLVISDLCKKSPSSLNYFCDFGDAAIAANMVPGLSADFDSEAYEFYCANSGLSEQDLEHRIANDPKTPNSLKKFLEIMKQNSSVPAGPPNKLMLQLAQPNFDKELLRNLCNNPKNYESFTLPMIAMLSVLHGGRYVYTYDANNNRKPGDIENLLISIQGIQCFISYCQGNRLLVQLKGNREMSTFFNSSADVADKFMALMQLKVALITPEATTIFLSNPIFRKLISSKESGKPSAENWKNKRKQIDAVLAPFIEEAKRLWESGGRFKEYSHGKMKAYLLGYDEPGKPRYPQFQNLQIVVNGIEKPVLDQHILERLRVVAPYVQGQDPQKVFAARYNSASKHTMQGNHQQAIEDYSKAIALSPKSPSAYHNRGNAYFRSGDYLRASEDYSKVIALDPKLATAYCSLGNAHFLLGENKRALEDYSKSIELEPKDASTHLCRGQANDQLGNYNQSIEDYSKAIELDPKHGVAHYKRGIAFAKLGNIKREIEDLKTAARLGLKWAQESLKSKGIQW